MTSLRIVAVVLLAAGETGVAFCAGAANAPAVAAPAPLPAAAHLMTLAFPGWADSMAGRVQTVTLPAPVPSYAGWSAGSLRLIAEPKLVLRLDGSHLTLVAGLAPAGEDGKPAAGQLTPMALAAYQFEQHGNAWVLAGRQGVFAWRGFYGTAKVRAVPLSTQRQGIVVDYGSCWDGYCGTWMALYEMDKGSVRREPAVEMALSGTNANSAADCGRRLQPLVKARTPEMALVATPERGRPDGHDCYAIESSWTLDASSDQPGDLVLRYQGAMSRAEARLAAPATVDQRQVLRYGSGKYRAISGFNPVPPI